MIQTEQGDLHDLDNYIFGPQMRIPCQWGLVAEVDSTMSAKACLRQVLTPSDFENRMRRRGTNEIP